MNDLYDRPLTVRDEKFFRKLLDNTMECIWVLDVNTYKYLYVSQSVYKLRGVTAEEAMKENFQDTLTIESLQKIKNSGFKRVQRFLAGDRSDEIVFDVNEYEQFCKDGSIIIIETSTQLVFNEETKGVELIGISRDITKRKHYEKKLIYKLRKQNEIIRKQQFQPVNKNNLPQVYFFDKFKVISIGHEIPLKWRTTKTEELFAFLLHSETNFISKCEICNSLWPDTVIEKTNTYLHTTLYNLKKDLKAAGISLNLQFTNGYYFYNLPTFYSDISELKNLIEKTVLPFNGLDEQSVRSIENAISLYQGDYLSKNGYSWAMTRLVLYHKRFEEIAVCVARYYFYKHDYFSAKKVLLKLIHLDNLNEKFHELLLKVYIYENDYESFIEHYNYLKILLKDELNVSPNASIQTMYDQFHDLAQNSIKNKTAFF